MSAPTTNKPLRVRTPRYYATQFVVDHGQRNAEFIKRPMQWGVHRYVPFVGAFAYLPEPGYDLIHTTGAVPLLTKRPYIVSFESFLPRFPDDEHVGTRLEGPGRALERFARKRLVQDQCLAVLAYSEYAMRQFARQSRGAPERAQLEEKMELLYPAIRLRADRPKPKPEKLLRLLLVGRNFMGKGGPALLRAHGRLRSLGIPVETTIVSSLDWSPDDYIGPSSKAYVDAEVARLSQDGVVFHRGLPNERVLELMAAATYFVFPTMHDTFGFAPLEALASGTPVIATATCAQPEIVAHGDCGFLLPFENDVHVGKWPWIYRRSDPGHLDAFDTTIERSAAAIVETAATAWESRGDYERMSAAALDRIKTRFNRDRARERLETLYERAR